MKTLGNIVKKLLRYPSAVVGLVIIGTLIGVAIYAVISISYSEAIKLWQGGGGIWSENPRNAQPRWFNLFPGINLPETIVLSSKEVGSKTVKPLKEGMSEVKILLPFDYKYDDFPSELTIFFKARYKERQPHASLTWVTSEGREIHLVRRGVGTADVYRLSLDKSLARRLDEPPEVKLFADSAAAKPFKGKYELKVEGLLFEEGSDIDVKLVVYGQVHGLAGTDHLRRDLMVALLWGTPVALTFGFLAAIGATVSTFIIAAIGVWFGRWVDAVIRWITQVNVILPLLPILIMVGMLYSRSIWMMLGVVIALGIFSASLFVYRAMFLPIKESPYIEAARAYGAGNFRIIFRYLIPKIAPVLIPTFVILIPIYVFLEATLAVLGLGDPLLPTWGKVIYDALNNGAHFMGYYYWLLLPSALLMVTGFGFTMLGFTLDRIFNPRLRGL